MSSQILLGAFWNRLLLAPTSRPVSQKSWYQMTLTPPSPTLSAVSVMLCSQLLSVQHVFIKAQTEKKICRWTTHTLPPKMNFPFQTSASGTAQWKSKWQISAVQLSQTRSAVQKQRHCFVLSGQSQVAANINCLNLQWHPLESARGEEDDWWHQLAAQSGTNHDLEPCLNGDSHTLWLFLILLTNNHDCLYLSFGFNFL